MGNQAREVYDEMYYQGNGQSGDRVALGMYVRILRNYVKNGLVLDYGAGEGFLSKRLSRVFTKVFTYDYSPYSRVVCAKNAPEACVLDCMDNLERGVLDAIICLHTLEHIEEPGETLSNFNHKLRMGGILLFVVPNPCGLGKWIKKDQWFAFRDQTHVSLMSDQDWISLALQNGFSVVKKSSDGFWDVPYLPLLPIWLQKLLFYPSCAMMVMLGTLIYPSWFGEDLILVLKKHHEL